MAARWIASFANLLLVAYCLDAGLSVVDEVVRASTGWGGLMALRGALASFVMYLAVLCVLLLWWTPRLPLGLFAGLIASALWLNTGAAPLPLFFDSLGGFSFAASLAQAGIGAFVLFSIRRRNGGSGWLLRSESLSGPLFSLRHSALFALACLALTPVLALYGVLSLLSFVHVGTQGFVSFDLGGVTLADRRYEKGDQEVRLVGMMHIGEEAAYAELVRSFGGESTIVLEEGISDERTLLGDTLDYGGAAEFLGLAQQSDFRSYLELPDETLPEWPVLRNADVDVSAFDPLTIEWLGFMAKVWDSPSPLSAMRELIDRGSENPQELVVVQRDILDMRNMNLLTEVERALDQYRNVIVAWGALHLPYVASEIRALGFAEVRRERHRLVAWSTVLGALF